jgi:Tol biopolymer transport system component
MTVSRLIGTALLAASLMSATASAQYLPQERAGVIGKPAGKIAFLREKNVWIMNADNTDQQKVCNATNADGRLSWSPDGERIAFTRSGTVNVKGPDLLGGFYKVYDIFNVILDSVYNNNIEYWIRPTLDLGSRDPEWSANGQKIVFWKDLNANRPNAGEPNYQLCIMDGDGNNIEIVRKDWQNPSAMFKSPSMNAAGDIATIIFSPGEKRDVGLAIIPAGKYMMSADSINAQAKRNPSWIAPSWSPDGKWIAAVSAKMYDASLYILSADLKEKFLIFKPSVGLTMTTYAASWSPDGKWLTFSTNDGSIWICDITGQGARRLSGPGTDFGPAWSKTATVRIGL